MGNDKRREVTNRIISLLEQTDISQGYPNLYQRIKEWIDEIPTEKAHDGDLVYRKDAIDAILSLQRWVIDNNGEFQPVDAQTMSMIDPDDAVSAIENLPSIKTAVITCKDCKHRPTHIDNIKGKYFTRSKIEFPDSRCICQCEDSYYNWYPPDDFYCGHAERREDER